MWKKVNNINTQGIAVHSYLREHQSLLCLHIHRRSLYATSSSAALHLPTRWSIHVWLTFNLILNPIASHRSQAFWCDNLPPWFTKLTGPFIAELLVRLYALSLLQSQVPLQWKRTMTTPVPKQHLPAGVLDYRLITIIPVLSTILQKYWFGVTFIRCSKCHHWLKACLTNLHLRLLALKLLHFLIFSSTINIA